MTIDEAIKILDDWRATLPHFSPRERRDAARLGIEALKRVKDNRKTKLMLDIGLLPGETKD